ncbi:MAG: helix-turn-helix transcriptional regulator [Clostridia bacterium]|nr:helix-turn-helix transcriptional regulator [Clostridia bacterium]
MKQRERLARLLEQKEMSAYALAKAIGYKPQTVYNWVYGHGTPTPAVMLKMTKIFGVSAQKILEIFAEDKK